MISSEYAAWKSTNGTICSWIFGSITSEALDTCMESNLVLSGGRPLKIVCFFYTLTNHGA